MHETRRLSYNNDSYVRNHQNLAITNFRLGGNKTANAPKIWRHFRTQLFPFPNSHFFNHLLSVSNVACFRLRAVLLYQLHDCISSSRPFTPQCSYTAILIYLYNKPISGRTTKFSTHFYETLLYPIQTFCQSAELHLTGSWLSGSSWPFRQICQEIYKTNLFEITGYRIKYSAGVASRTSNQTWS
jgi:hypothetical protein